MREEAALRWRDACAATAVFAVDPIGTGGISLRAPAGPVREAWLARLRRMLPSGSPIKRMPPNVADGRLLGGLDLTGTLRAGRPVVERGLLAELDGGVALLTMAERIEPLMAARLLAVLDTQEVCLERDGLTARLPTRFGVVALDEGLDPDERPPAGILDRLACHLDLTTVDMRTARDESSADEEISAARVIAPRVHADEQVIEALCAAASAFGIASVRAPLLALRVARAAAALARRSSVDQSDLALAARLVFAPRATTIPAPEDTAESQQQEAQPDTAAPERSDADDGDRSGRPLDEMILEATRAAIPPGLLAALTSGVSTRGYSQVAGRAGLPRMGRRRGRPAGTRRGELEPGARLNVVETLRAAAPWQPLRRREQRGSSVRKRVEVRADDFRIARYKQRSQTTSVFVVDASGSSALHRLAEAKGAVELLLADCYVRRDQVALIAFRGRAAELVLPPTRSLVRAKRGLAGLPGGGGTPLASALEAALQLSLAIRRSGDTPVVVLLTDGQANVALDGAHGRSRATEDVAVVARAVARARIATLVIDTSPRPRPQARQLAADLSARYIPMPHADARVLSGAVRTVADSSAGSAARSV